LVSSGRNRDQDLKTAPGLFLAEGDASGGLQQGE